MNLQKIYEDGVENAKALYPLNDDTDRFTRMLCGFTDVLLTNPKMYQYFVVDGYYWKLGRKFLDIFPRVQLGIIPDNVDILKIAVWFEKEVYNLQIPDIKDKIDYSYPKTKDEIVQKIKEVNLDSESGESAKNVKKLEQYYEHLQFVEDCLLTFSVDPKTIGFLGIKKDEVISKINSIKSYNLSRIAHLQELLEELPKKNRAELVPIDGIRSSKKAWTDASYRSDKYISDGKLAFLSTSKVRSLPDGNLIYSNKDEYLDVFFQNSGEIATILGCRKINDIFYAYVESKGFRQVISAKSLKFCLKITKADTVLLSDLAVKLAKNGVVLAVMMGTEWEWDI